MSKITFTQMLTPNSEDYCTASWYVRVGAMKVGYLNQYGANTYSFDVLGDHSNKTSQMASLEIAQRAFIRRLKRVAKKLNEAKL